MNTTYFLNLVAGNIFGSKTNPSIPSDYYIGVSSTKPNLDGTGVTEPTTGGYVRVKITDLGEPVDGVVSNKEALSWPKTNADWGVMKYYVIYGSNDSSAPLLMFGELLKSRTVESDDILTIEPGVLQLSVVNPS